MTRPSRSRRTWSALIAAVPIATIMVALGAASPAPAGVITGNCPSSDTVCFWKDNDYMPTNEKLSLAGTNSDWRLFGSTICAGGNWNDCASSVQNRYPAGGKTMYAWQDINCQGHTLTINPGQDYNSMPTINGFDWNDQISSDRVSAGTGC